MPAVEATFTTVPRLASRCGSAAWMVWNGPVVLTASLHVSLNATNALIQETVRAFYTGWYKELVTEVPRVGMRIGLPLASIPVAQLSLSANRRAIRNSPVARSRT